LEGTLLAVVPTMTDFEDRIRRMAREAMGEIGRDADEIADVLEPPGADYCVVSFRDPELRPIEIPKPLGAGESQEQDEIRRALQYRFHT
jgi:hypothetical protein